MGRPRWNKILRDLWGNRTRTLLVLLSLTIGVFAVAIVADSYAILLREMNFNYLRTDPSSATLWVSPLGEDILARVRAMPGISQADVRTTIRGRIQIGDKEWKTIELFVVRDFQEMPVDRIYSESGVWPPADGDILIERAAVRLTPSQTGDKVSLSIPGGTGCQLRYAGTAYAPGLAPAWMEGELYGFVTPGTLAMLGGKNQWQELRIQFTDSYLDQEVVRAQAQRFADKLRAEGLTVSQIDVPIPGQHPHALQMSALLYLLEAFGLLALILSSILAANMISAIMSREVRQIGIMKALGASPAQITWLYLGMVGFLGLLGMLIALPAGYLAARAYAQFAGSILNFTIFRDDVPLPYWLLQIGLGLLLPMLVAAIPILRGSRIPIREAISDYGIRVREFGRSWLDRLLARLSFLPRIALLAIRNAFRRRTRAFLTVLTLTAAGTCFITAMNVSSSMNQSVDSKFAAVRYDTLVAFNQPYPSAQLQSVFAGVPGLTRLETWGGAKAAIIRSDGSIGNAFQLIAPNADTQLMAPPSVAAGRWLLPADTNALVINQAVGAREPEAQVGSTISLQIGGKASEWKIVGFVWELMGPPTMYANQEFFDQITGMGKNAGIIVAQSADRSAPGVARLTRGLEARMQAAPLDVSSTLRMEDWKDIIKNHLVILSSFLVLMSILVLIVGGLGLGSTLSINILERRREIGVMRATGASGLDVTILVAGEGLMIGLFSWLLAVLAAEPVGRWITHTFGMSFFQGPLEFSYSIAGALLWLGIVIVFAAVASFLPAWDASRLPVQEVLAYE